MIDSTTALAQTVAGAQALADNVNALQAQVDSLSAANIGLQAQCDAAQQTIAGLNATIAQQSAQIASLLAQTADPRTTITANTSGTVDATSAIQAMLDKGGKLTLPAGRYQIDPARGLTLKVAGTDLLLDPNAVLVVRPNSLPKYRVLWITADDCVVNGGQILGDRAQHIYTSGSTHEWGCGVMVTGNRAKVAGLKVSGCTGDGVGVSGDDCVIDSVVSTGNRRNGLSAYDCVNLKIEESEFSNTGNGGATDPAGLSGPFAGIDVEPDKAFTTTVSVDGCKLNNNRVGFLAWLRAEVGGSITANVANCTITGNTNGMQAHAYAGKISVTANGNTLSNKASGCRVETGAAFAIDGNTFDFTGSSRTAQTITGTNSVTKYDIYLPSTGPGTAKVGTNTYK